MTATTQILLGSVVLILCSFLHMTLLVSAKTALLWTAARTRHLRSPFAVFRPMVIAFSFVLFAHTIQVWFWALSFVGLGTFSEFSEAIYFALATYTTVGYGDVTLEKGARIFGVMAAVTGLLNFGLSTAFLVGVFGSTFVGDKRVVD